MPWENGFADTSAHPGRKAERRRAAMLVLLMLAGSGGSAENSPAPQKAASPETREYVQQVRDMTGLPVTVKHVSCLSGGQPDTLAEVYLIQRGGRYQVGRVELNARARQVLDEGRKFPTTRNYYDRYIVRGESFSGLSLNAVLGFWRLLGMRFTLESGEYTCQVT